MGILDIIVGILFILIVAKIVVYSRGWNKRMEYPEDKLKWWQVGPIKKRRKPLTATAFVARRNEDV